MKSKFLFSYNSGSYTSQVIRDFNGLVNVVGWFCVDCNFDLISFELQIHLCHFPYIKCCDVQKPLTINSYIPYNNLSYITSYVIKVISFSVKIKVCKPFLNCEIYYRRNSTLLICTVFLIADLCFSQFSLSSKYMIIK